MTDFLSRFEGKIGSIQRNGKVKLVHQQSLAANLAPNAANRAVILSQLFIKPNTRGRDIIVRNAAKLDSDFLNPINHQKYQSVDYPQLKSYGMTPRTQAGKTRKISLATKLLVPPGPTSYLTPPRPIKRWIQNQSDLSSSQRILSCDAGSQTTPPKMFDSTEANQVNIEYQTYPQKKPVPVIHSLRNRKQRGRRLRIPIMKPKSPVESGASSSFDATHTLMLDSPYKLVGKRLKNTDLLSEYKSFDEADKMTFDAAGPDRKSFDGVYGRNLQDLCIAADRKQLQDIQNRRLKSRRHQSLNKSSDCNNTEI